MLVFNGRLTDVERNEVGVYLSKKYNFSTSYSIINIPAPMDTYAIKNQPVSASIATDVVAVTAVFPNSFYVEETNRHSGIQVELAPATLSG